MAAPMSAGVARHGLMSSWVRIRTSSSAITLAGSAVATRSFPSSNANGIIIQLRASSPEMSSGCGVVDHQVAEIDETHPDLRRERGHQLTLGDHSLVDQHAAERTAEALVLLEGLGQLGGRDETALDQDVA